MTPRLLAVPILLLLLHAECIAQVDSTTAPADSVTAPGSVGLRPRGSLRLPATAAPLSATTILRDSLLLIEYHDAADVLAAMGARQYGLGNFVQPTWAGRGGSLPQQTALLHDGLGTMDAVSGAPLSLAIHPETAVDVVMPAMHEAFWTAGCGVLMAADYRSLERTSPHPFSQIRHSEGPYGMLYTNVLFNQDAGERANLDFTLTRQTVGYSTSNNIARFPNERAEDWNIEASVRLRISDRLTLRFGDHYFDQTSLQWGGVAGWRAQGGVMVYPDPTRGYADTAFSSILATQMNATMKLQQTVNAVRGSAEMDWTGTGTHSSRLDASFTTSRRTVTDDLATGADGEIYAALDDDVRWSEAALHVVHHSSLEPMQLDLVGDASSIVIDALRPAFSGDAITTGLGGRLGFGVSQFSVSVFGRLDQRHSQTATGMGVTVEDSSLAGAGVWAGASVSTRPFTYLERTAAEGFYDALVIGQPDDRLERHLIAEAGVRLHGTLHESELRITLRRMTAYRTLGTVLERDTIPVRFRPLVEYGERTLDAAAVDLVSRWRFWMLGLDLHGSMTATSRTDLSVAPGVAGSASLFITAALFNSSLRLKAGATAAYSSAFSPTWYNPRIGIFGLPSATLADALSARPYTEAFTLDLFVFARIKENATIHVLLDNLLDARHISTQFMPMSERSVRFGVTWDFLD